MMSNMTSTHPTSKWKLSWQQSQKNSHNSTHIYTDGLAKSVYNKHFKSVIYFKIMHKNVSYIRKIHKSD